MTLLDTTEKLRRDRVLIESLIDDPSLLGPDFQQIKNLTDGTVVGYKATGRGQTGTELDSTLALLQSAQSTGLAERLDWAFRCLALDRAVDAGLTSELHLTPEADTFGSPCPPRLMTAFNRGRRALKVAAEIHDDGFDHPGLDAAVAEWRGFGWRVVVADVSHRLDAAFGRRLEQLRPDAVQLDLSRPVSSGTEQLAEWANTHGVELHATHLDLESRRAQALALGVTVGRGRVLGAPGPLG